MTDSPQPVDLSSWRDILSLGRQLLSQPTPAAQRELIVEETARLLGAQADLWLAEIVRQPDTSDSQDQLGPTLTAPQSDLMRRALKARQTMPSGVDELHAALAVAVPLVAHDAILGVLEARRPEGPPFTSAESILLESIAGQASFALEASHLVAAERWRCQVADSLQEVAGLLSAGVTLDQVLEVILTELGHALPYDVAGIWLLHEDALCLSAVRGHTMNVCISDFSQDGTPWLYQALEADQPLIRIPGAPAEPLGAAAGFPSDYSAIAAPLHARDRRLGLLTLIHHAAGRYSADSQAMIAAFASHATVAIENARLYQESQELALISTVMLQVAQASQSLATLDEVLETVVHLVATLAGVDQCALLLWDEHAEVFLPATAYRLDPAQRALFDQWHIAPGDTTAFDDLRANKAPTFVEDVATDSRLSGTDVRAMGFGSPLLLPLLAQDEVLGAVLIDYESDASASGTVAPFRDERLAMIQGIAHQTAAAIETARLREAQQEEAYVSAALLQVAQVVAGRNELRDVLGAIVRIMPILVGVRRCVVFLWDDEHATFWAAAAHGLPRDARPEADGPGSILAQRYAPGDFPLLDAACERDQVIVHAPGSSPARSGDEESLLPSDFATRLLGHPREEPRPLLAVPLSVQGDVAGAMLLEADPPGRSRERWLELINGIARQTALAIQNDRLQREMAEHERLERELQLAHEVQEALIPREPPDLPGWELSFHWQAARQVAGDFYDFFELPGGRLGLAIADVADKGMAAALFMATTRTLLRAAALEQASPASSLARVNDLLIPDNEQGMFVTVFYAALSLKSGELTYANAGHNRPLLLRSNTGELERLGEGGMALGVLQGTRLEDNVVSLQPGDSLILCTDGITEAFSPQGEVYGEDGLRATVKAAGGGSAREMVDVIDRSVRAFTGDAPSSDDRTLVVLRRLEK